MRDIPYLTFGFCFPKGHRPLFLSFVLLLAAHVCLGQTPQPFQLKVRGSVGEKVVLQQQVYARDGTGSLKTIDSLRIPSTLEAVLKHLPKMPGFFLVNGRLLLAEGGEYFELDLSQKRWKLPPAQNALDTLMVVSQEIEKLRRTWLEEKDKDLSKTKYTDYSKTLAQYKPKFADFFQRYSRTWSALCGLAIIGDDYMDQFLTDSVAYQTIILPNYTYGEQVLTRGTDFFIANILHKVQIRNHLAGETATNFTGRKLPFPPVKYTDRDGKQITLDEFPDKIKVIVQGCGYVRLRGRLDTLVSRDDVMYLQMNIAKEDKFDDLGFHKQAIMVRQKAPEQIPYYVCEALFIIDKKGILEYAKFGHKGRDAGKIAELVNGLQ